MSESDAQSNKFETIQAAMKGHEDLLGLLMEGESESAVAREKLKDKVMILFTLSVFLFLFGGYQYQKAASLENDLEELGAQVVDLENSMDELMGHTHGPQPYRHTHY